MKTRTVKTKPKTIKIGHGYYDLKTIRELVNSLPDGELTLKSYPGKPNANRYNSQPPKIVCQYHRGDFTLNAPELHYYVADNGKATITRHLRYYQDYDLPDKTFSLLPVNLPMEVLKCQL